MTNGFAVQEVDWRDDPDHDAAWRDGESAKYGGPRSVYWLQNYERKLIRGGMPVWPFLDEHVHVRVIPRERLLSREWVLVRSLDQGMRHPTCCAWSAVNERGDRHFYRQYYRTGTTVGLNAKAILEMTPPEERVGATAADPAIWERSPDTGQILADVYGAAGLELVKADNSAAGYETLTAGFLSTLARYWLFVGDLVPLRLALATPNLSEGDARALAAAPEITFSPACAGAPLTLFDQCLNFRWAKQTGDPGERAAPERFQDVEDEGVDVVRYACQTAALGWANLPKTAPPKDLLMEILGRRRR
jgi:hypothetical protein